MRIGDARVTQRRSPVAWVSCGLWALLLLGPMAACAGLNLSAYCGMVVYVDFWASWCGPCKQSFPWLDGLLREYGSQNFIVIGVYVDKDRDRAERTLKETPAEFSIVYDPKGELATSYKVAGMPSGILIDRAGPCAFSACRVFRETEGAL